MAKEKKKEQRYHNGIPVDSDEEVLCLMWLEELMQAGYVQKIERAETYSLFDGLTNVYEQEKQLKTKVTTVEKRQVLLSAHEYTPEFIVRWTPKAVNTILWEHYKDVNEKFDKQLIYRQLSDSPVTYIEVKPSYDQNNMTRLFKINQKWMYEKWGIYINLVQPEQLCHETFTPKGWLTTRTGKTRTIHWTIRTVEEYLETLKK